MVNIGDKISELTPLTGIDGSENIPVQKGNKNYRLPVSVLNGSVSLKIRKVYNSVSAMNSDGTAPVGSDGTPIKAGEIVSIYNSENSQDPDNNSIYSFQNPGWLQTGKLSQVDSDLDENSTNPVENRVVSNSIHKLQNDLNNITGKSYNVDFELVKKYNGVINSGKWEATSSSAYNHTVLNVYKGQRINVVPNEQYITEIAYLSTHEVVQGAAVDFVEGKSLIKISEGFNKKEFDVPQDCILYIRTDVHPKSVVIENIAELDKYAIKDDVNAEFNRVFGVNEQINIQSLKSNPGVIENGSWIATSSSSSYTHAVIPISGIELISIVGNSQYSTNYGFLKSYNKPVSGESADLCNGTSIIRLSVNQEQSYKVPDDCNYLYIETKTPPSRLSLIVNSILDGFSKKGAIDNNLFSEKEKIENVDIKNKDGEISNDNYGKDDVTYKFKGIEGNVLHIRFKFQFTNVLGYSSSKNNYICAVKSGSTIYKVTVRQANPLLSGNTVFDKKDIVVINKENAYASIGLQNFSRKQWDGGNSFYVAYTGEMLEENKDIVMMITSSSVEFKHKNTNEQIGIVQYNSDDDVKSLIQKINGIENVKAQWINVVNRKCGELMINESNEIPMYVEYTDPEGTKQGDFAPVFVRYQKDESWHLFEAIIDINNKVSYTNIDGETIKLNLTGIESWENCDVVIGGTSDLSINTPIRVRDLHIGINSYEDCEIIVNPNPVNPGTNELVQMISDYCPKVIIFEGHGVENKQDGDSLSNGMSVTTDRLRYVFEYLKNKGYVPISYKELIAWKKYGKSIPKRSYLMMFDDWQISLFGDINLSNVFYQYNVPAGLAIISGRERTEEVEFNGYKYTLGTIFDSMVRQGFYPCSHTDVDMNGISHLRPSKMVDEFYKYSVSCRKLGIYDDILVYPLGSYNNSSTKAMEISNFCLGIAVDSNDYNSAMKSDYNLHRIEIARVELQDLIDRIL